jgi:hypothetical protein
MIKKILLIIIVLTANNIVFGQEYWKILKNAVSKNDENYKEFGWVSYPTNNNGVLSMGKSGGAKFNLGQSRCPTFTCLGLSESLIDTPDGINVISFVTKTSGDASNLNNAETRKLIIDSTLPHFLKTIGIQLNLDRKKVINLDFSFGGLMMREALPAEVIGYLESIDSNTNATLTQQSISRLYRKEKLSIITKDIVIEKMSFSLEIVNINNFGVKAELDQKVGKVFGEDSTMKVEVSRFSDSKYKIETTRPLIIARFYQNAKDLKD